MSAANATPTNIADKRAAILETTLKLLSERGFHNTPMSVIVKELGVSTGIVYHYFANKDELITELYRQIKTKTFQTLLAGYDENASYQERFLYLWKSIIYYYLDHPKETNFLEQYEHSPYYDMGLSTHYSDQIKPLLMFFRKGVEDNVLKDLPLEILMALGTAALAKQDIRGAFHLNDEIINAAAKASWDTIQK